MQIDNLIDINVEANDNERQCRSTPGHLLHWVYEGDYELLIKGEHYKVNEGDFIYYYNSEDVYWLRNLKKVRFMSLAFQANNLNPISSKKRVFNPSLKALELFKQIIHLLNSSSIPFQNELAIAKLLELISNCFEENNLKTSVNAWRTCEDTLISKSIYRSSLNQMAKFAKVSTATLARSCHNETGLPPLRRLQKLRMEKALNLVRHSTMRITEIANHLGYDRIHEFSREFKLIYSVSPNQERKRISA